MFVSHAWLALLWIFYGALHSILAAIPVKQYVQKKFPAAYPYYRLLYNLQAFAGLLLIVWFHFRVPAVLLFQPTSLTRLGGTALALGGLSLMAVCVKKYFLSLSGLRSFWQDVPAEGLIITGVHRYIRHPLYLGTFAFLWGLVLFSPTASLFLSAFVITGYTLLGLRWEEKKLVREFGEAYRTYQRTVPKIFPRL